MSAHRACMCHDTSRAVHVHVHVYACVHSVHTPLWTLLGRENFLISEVDLHIKYTIGTSEAFLIN